MNLEVFIDNDNYQLWSLKPKEVTNPEQALTFNSRSEAVYAKKIIESWKPVYQYDTEEILRRNYAK